MALGSGLRRGCKAEAGTVSRGAGLGGGGWSRPGKQGPVHRSYFTSRASAQHPSEHSSLWWEVFWREMLGYKK